MGVVGGFQVVPGQHGVAAFDVAVVVHHGFGHRLVAAGADVPLQEADPQHQLGQGGGAFVELDAAQLLQRDRFAFQAQAVLEVGIGVEAKGLQLVEHFALQALEVLQRDIQEVAAAAGRVQHAGGAELVVEAVHFGAGFGHLGVVGLATEFRRLLRQHDGGGLGVGPVGAQRLHYGGQHQSLHIGARRVVGAQGVALGGVERAFQQGAEDGGFHLAPVGACGGDEQVDLLLIQ